MQNNSLLTSGHARSSRGMRNVVKVEYDLVERKRPPIKVADAVSRYVEGLKYAFTAPAGTDNPVKAMRLRYAVALLETTNFVKRAEEIYPSLEGAFERFLELTNMIADLDLGVAHPVLVPSKIGYRVPDRADVWAVRLNTVVGLEGLIRAGDSRTKAAKQIAKRFKKLSRALRNPKDDLEGSIKSWQSSLRNGTTKNRTVAENCKYNMHMLDAFAHLLIPDGLRAMSMERLAAAEQHAIHLVLNDDAICD